MDAKKSPWGNLIVQREGELALDVQMSSSIEFEVPWGSEVESRPDLQIPGFEIKQAGQALDEVACSSSLTTRRHCF